MAPFTERYPVAYVKEQWVRDNLCPICAVFSDEVVDGKDMVNFQSTVVSTTSANVSISPQTTLFPSKGSRTLS
jgi:hypothetical protein